MIHEPVAVETDAVGRAVVDAAFTVHRTLGPGLLESVYEACLAHELRKRAYDVSQQVYLPVVYDGIRLDSGLRLDLIVSDVVIVEIKSVERMLPVFEAQMLTYLRLSGKRLGYLVNFNVPLIKAGLRRFVI